VVRRYGRALLAALFALFAAMTLSSRLLPAQPAPLPATIADAWRPELARVRSVAEAERILPAYVAHETGSRERRTAAAVDRFLRDRFFHGASEISWQENWVARLAGLAWLNLRIPVRPDSILQHRRALCSQQSIVFMELLRRQGIASGAVLMRWPSADPASRGHLAVAARVDGQWLFYDPDQEARQVGVPLDRVIDGSALPRLYRHKPALLAGARWAARHGAIRLAHVNADPAPRGGLFERWTEWLSAYGWLALALALALVAPASARLRFAAGARPARPALRLMLPL